MGNCAGLLRFLQTLRLIYINHSYAKFISPVVQIYLAVLAIANSFLENCVWLRVAWQKLDEYETKLNNKTECRIFPYKWVLAHSRKLSAKIMTWKFMQIMSNLNWHLIQSLDWLLFWRSNYIMICFSSPERDYLLSKGDMTLEKGLRSQHSKDFQLHDSLRSPTSSKWTTNNFCWHVIDIDVIILCINLIREPKWFKLTTCDWIRRISMK